MNKYFPYLVVAVFLASSLAGYQLASKLYIDTPSNNIAQNQNEKLAQKNFAIVQVDTIDSSLPNLLSVWFAFYRTDKTPYVMFLQVYPTGSPKKDLDLLQRYQFSDKGIPSKEFLAYLTKQFDLKINGYMVVDQYALNSSTKNSKNNTVSINTWLTNLCNTNKSSVSTNGFANLSSSHFNTGGDWNAEIGSLKKFPACEILQP